jgi:hypothetical protein
MRRSSQIEFMRLTQTSSASRLKSKASLWAGAAAVPIDVYVAQWKKHGRAAGPIRNQRMLDKGKPDLVVAFPAALEPQT